MKSLRIAVIGCGAFARSFIELLCRHPYTERVYVCDLIRERAENYAKSFGVEIVESFEAALADPRINCIANFTERHKHGDITIRALSAGKHVYSAVPMASTVEECTEIVRLVEKTGLTYMIGETCYYYPCAIFCRDAYKKGKFGEFSYAAAQYYHHIDCISYGRRPKERGMPPLLYPTHSTAMVLGACGSYATKVACFGVRDRTGDVAFTPEGNEWGNEFINQTFLMQLENGGVARITEARGLGWAKPSSYISAFYGTRAGYEFSNAQHLFIERDFSRPNEDFATVEDVSDLVNPRDMVKSKDLPDFKTRVACGDWQYSSMAEIQAEEYRRIPAEYQGLRNGHMASHQLLIDDFCCAAARREIPTLNAFFAARINIPGLIAIESVKAGGVTLPVPDLGDAPKG